MCKLWREKAGLGDGPSSSLISKAVSAVSPPLKFDTALEIQDSDDEVEIADENGVEIEVLVD